MKKEMHFLARTTEDICGTFICLFLWFYFILSVGKTVFRHLAPYRMNILAQDKCNHTSAMAQIICSSQNTLSGHLILLSLALSVPSINLNYSYHNN